MSQDAARGYNNIPDFDVLSENPHKSVSIVSEVLRESGIHNVNYKETPGLSEVIPFHIELRIGKDTIAFIHQPLACHNYNVIKLHGKEVRVATIDTMLSFYLAFTYSPQFRTYRNRLLCMAQWLFRVQEANRLSQKGLLKRFTTSCYGKQATLETIRAEKAKKYQELQKSGNIKEFEKWFLKYTPGEAMPPSKNSPPLEEPHPPQQPPQEKPTYKKHKKFFKNKHFQHTLKPKRHFNPNHKKRHRKRTQRNRPGMFGF